MAECQTLPSTSSLSGANSAELAPRRKTTLPKAAVFILPKRTSSRYPSQDVFQSASSSSVPFAPPSSPLSDMTAPTASDGLDTSTSSNSNNNNIATDTTDYDTTTALPAELRGRVRLLPRLPLVEYEPSNIDITPPKQERSAYYYSTPTSHRENRLAFRRPRHATTDNSGLKQLMPHGARVAIGGSIQAAEAVLALSTSTARNNTTTAAVRRGSPCPYDDFVSTTKPSFWRRFKSKVRASLGPTHGPKPNLPISAIVPGHDNLNS